MADAEAAPVAPSPSPAPLPPSPVPPARAEAPRGLDPSPPSPSSASSRRWTPRGLFGAVVRGSSTTLRLDVIRPSFGRRREMDTDYKGWGGADSRRAFETNKTFVIERLKFKATQKWRGFLFRADDALSDDAEAPSHAAPLGVRAQCSKTKARLDFGFGVAFTPGGDPSRDVSSRGFRSGTFRPECRLKARFSADDFAPRLTARLAPEPELAVGATVPLEGPLDALLALGAPRRERERARGESEPGGNEGTRERGSGTPRRGACVRVEAVAPLSVFFKNDDTTSKPFGNKGVSVTARLVRPEARGVFVSTNGLEFDFPEIPLLRGRDESIEPGDAVAARVRGAIDFPRAGLGANAGGLERVDGGDAPVRVTVRELGVKRVVRWWRRPSLSATARGDAADG